MEIKIPVSVVAIFVIVLRGLINSIEAQFNNVHCLASPPQTILPDTQKTASWPSSHCNGGRMLLFRISAYISISC